MATHGSPQWFDAILILAFCCYLSFPRKFERPVVAIASLPYYLLSTTLYILFLFSRGFLKLILFVGVAVLASFAYILSIPVSYFGRFSLSRYVSRALLRIVNEDRVSRTRANLIDIMLVKWDGPPEFDTESEYREELVGIRKNAVENIERGETIISIVFGLLTLSVYAWEVNLPEYTILRHTFTFVELYLFLLSGALLYRVSFLEIATFGGDEEFDSLAEWDAAMTLQRGICELRVVEFGIFLICLGHVFSDRQFRVAFQVLRELVTGEVWWRDALSRANEIQKQEKEK